MNNMGTLLLLSLLSLCGTAVRAEEGASTDGKFPEFCGDRECPKFHLVQQYDSFELRAYEGTQWVTTELDDGFLGFGMVTSFRRLFNYISGKNSQGIKIEMTVPVLMQYPSKDTGRNATMSFFLSPSLVNPPQPLDPAVHLENSPPLSVYVLSFGGYALDYDYKKKAKALAEKLGNQGLSFDDSVRTTAGYNDPFTLLNRHNEVWYKAK
ncbi:heme binding protein 2 S homeolog precursor [Xenopus laevis]|uniref:Heme-binding protein 1 n=2 Tax=Xenopus laevis TaxID=8355 RepID=Q4ZJ76_XENLA|nr:heme binding protein 2 S homeolog precursor [Xenopus laevis]AAY26492.1 SOUL/heme-binding protein [Xenopus laevis]